MAQDGYLVDKTANIDNIQTGLINGLEAMGNILSGYADNEDAAIDDDTTHRFGWLLMTLAEIMDGLNFAHTNQQHKVIVSMGEGERACDG